VCSSSEEKWMESPAWSWNLYLSSGVDFLGLSPFLCFHAQEPQFEANESTRRCRTSISYVWLGKEWKTKVSMQWNFKQNWSSNSGSQSSEVLIRDWEIGMTSNNTIKIPTVSFTNLLQKFIPRFIGNLNWFIRSFHCYCYWCIPLYMCEIETHTTQRELGW
jgi:hypothetical protein